MSASRADRVLVQGPGWKKPVSIAADKHAAVARAIRAVLDDKPITLTELTRRVSEQLPGFEGSTAWYTVSVARDLEARGDVVRSVKPTRYAITAAGSRAG